MYSDLHIVFKLRNAIEAFERDSARGNEEILVAARVPLECCRERLAQMSMTT